MIMLLEICVDNIQSAVNAESAGADRIELCSALSEGGLTPTIGLFKAVKSLVSIPVFVIIRPRRGTDFVYSLSEVKAITLDAQALLEAGADGIVFGALNINGTIDSVVCAQIREIAIRYNAPVTFHRAFDMVSDPIEAMDNIIKLGYQRILTSGQARTAFEGMSVIRNLVGVANGRIIIMPGCGINESNIIDIIKRTNVTEVHASARKPIPKICEPGHKCLNSVSVIGTVDSDADLLVADCNVIKTLVLRMKELSQPRQERI